MAAVVRELWGGRPSFLNYRTRKTIFDLVGHLPDGGRGRRVACSDWFLAGKKHTYYELDQVEIDPKTSQAKIMGFFVQEGSRHPYSKPIRQAFRHNWRFYQSPDELCELQQKLGIEPPK